MCKISIFHIMAYVILISEKKKNNVYYIHCWSNESLMRHNGSWLNIHT